MKKTIKLKRFLEILNKRNKKDIKLSVEGMFDNQGKFSFQVKNIECDRKLAKELGFNQVIIDSEGKMKETKKAKQPTIRELMISGFDNLNKKVDSIDKRLSNVESDIKSMKNTSTMKKELENIQK